MTQCHNELFGFLFSLYDTNNIVQYKRKQSAWNTLLAEQNLIERCLKKKKQHHWEMSGPKNTDTHLHAFR